MSRIPNVTLTLQPARERFMRGGVIVLNYEIVTSICVDAVTLTLPDSKDHAIAYASPTTCEVRFSKETSHKLRRFVEKYVMKGWPGYDSTKFVEAFKIPRGYRKYTFGLDEVRPEQVMPGYFYAIYNSQMPVYFLGLKFNFGLGINDTTGALIVFPVKSLMRTCGATEVFKIARTTLL